MLIAKGAEAELYLVEWFGLRAVVKWRKPKSYRDPQLDYQIRRRRTVTEVRNMYICHSLGIDVPAVYFFDPQNAVIYMEYIEGETLRELINRGQHHHLQQVGALVGKMHKSGLIHGDLAPTNVIHRGGRLYFIDFGLGDVKRGWSRRTAVMFARDVNVLLRTLDMYGDKSEALRELFWVGYREEMPMWRQVELEVARIRASGRYADRGGPGGI